MIELVLSIPLPRFSARKLNQGSTEGNHFRKPCARSSERRYSSAITHDGVTANKKQNQNSKKQQLVSI
jgi:hypothetical protein